MRGIAMFSSPVDDPHMTKHTDSDEEEEKEDLVVKDDDNFVISAKVDRVSELMGEKNWDESWSCRKKVTNKKIAPTQENLKVKKGLKNKVRPS